MNRWTRGGRGDREGWPGTVRERSSGRARWTITASLGGFGLVGIAWDAGSTVDEAVATFLEFLEDDEQVRDVSPGEIPLPRWRRLHVMFQGQHKEIVFRSNWVAGFTVE